MDWKDVPCHKALTKDTQYGCSNGQRKKAYILRQIKQDPRYCDVVMSTRIIRSEINVRTVDDSSNATPATADAPFQTMKPWRIAQQYNLMKKTLCWKGKRTKPTETLLAPAMWEPRAQARSGIRLNVYSLPTLASEKALPVMLKSQISS